MKNILIYISFISICYVGMAFADNYSGQDNILKKQDIFFKNQDFGDVLVTGTIAEPSNLISVLSTDAASSEVSRKLFVGLLEYDKDLNIIPKAAESFEVLDNGLRLRFKLHKGIMWSDGNELDVDDVEFTYRFMIDPKTPTAYADDYKQIKEFRKIDRYSFEVTYEKPFVRSLITWMSDILPRRALENADLNITPQKRNPISCGPFRLHSWEPGISLTLVANKDYFRGRPYIDGILYRIIPDSSSMFLELKARKIDIMPLTPQQYVYQVLNDKEFLKHFFVHRDLSFGYGFLGYNLKHPLFEDVRVRRAIAHAINKNEVVNGALFEQGVPTIGPFRPGTWAYNENITDYQYSPEVALKILEDCGWIKDKDGWLKRNGKKFSFTILVNQGASQRAKTALIIQNQLKKIGIDVNIRVVEWATFINEFVNKGKFEAVILGWNITADPDIYNIWHSSNAVAGGLNFVGYANAEVDALLEEARSTFDQNIRKKAYDRFQEILHAEQPYCFLYVPYTLTAVDRRFRGIEPAIAGITYNLPYWWVPAKEQRYRHMLQP